MAVELTLPHGIQIPAEGTYYKTEMNQNWQLLDKNRITVGTLANRPAAGTAERFYFATDTGGLFYDNGATWLTAQVAAHAVSHGSGGSDPITVAQSQVTNLVTDLGNKADSNHDHNAAYAPISKGVTNGDSHDHNGGDGAQIDHANLIPGTGADHSYIDQNVTTTGNPTFNSLTLTNNMSAKTISVSGTTNIIGILQSNTAGTYMSVKDSGTTGDNVRYGSNGNDAVIYAGGLERVRVDTSGNVGIGTSPSAGYLFHLEAPSGNTNIRLTSVNATSGSFIQQNNGGNLDLRIANQETNGDIAFLPGGGTEVGRFTSGGQFLVSGDVTPGSDNTQNLGTAALSWNDVYANGAALTSDQRRKEAVAASDLGIDFINLLNPVKYKFKDEIKEAVTETRIVEKPVTKTVKKEVVKVINGVPILAIKTIEEPLFEEKQVYDEAGNPVEGMFHKVPVTEAVEETVEVEPAVNHTYTRPHYGLIAQEVKQVMDDLNIDFAGYVYNPEADKYYLRYTEFIAPLIKAVQEQQAQIDELKAQLAAR